MNEPTILEYVGVSRSLNRIVVTCMISKIPKFGDERREFLALQKKIIANKKLSEEGDLS